MLNELGQVAGDLDTKSGARLVLHDPESTVTDVGALNFQNGCRGLAGE